MGKVEVGGYVVGFGMLFRIADVFKGSGLVEAAILIENVSGQEWDFQWVPWNDFQHNFKEAEKW